MKPRRLGAKGVAFLAGQWEDATKELAYSQLMKTTDTLCTYAASKDMMIELEVFDFDIAKKSLMGPAPYAAAFGRRSQKQAFKLWFADRFWSHIPMTHESNQFVVRTLRPYLTHFHIGNTVCHDPKAAGYGDEHQRFGFPCSANDVPELVDFLRVLKEEGFFDENNPYVLSL